MTPERIPRVLLVEDNPADARLVRELLAEAAPHQVESATRLAQAVALLAAGRIDVILLDLGLPDSSGMATFHALRAAAPGVPVIVLSGHEDIGVAVHTVREGAEDYLLKGKVNGESLARAIAAALDRAEARERLRWMSQVIEQSPLSVVLTDTAGTIEYVNARFSKVTGYAPQEVLGKNPRILKSGHTPPEQYRRLWETITAGGEWRGELHNRRKDGTLFWEQASISAVRDGAGRITHFLALKEDVSARKELAERLAREREFTESAIGSFPGIFWVFDDHFVFLRWNRRVEEITGYRTEEIAGLTPLDLVVPEDREAVRACIDRALAQGSSAIEARLLTKDGQQIRHHLSGRRFDADGRAYVVGIGVDVSAWREAEDELKTSEVRYRRVVESNMIGIYEWYDDGRIVDANDKFLAIVGYDREDLAAGRLDWRAMTPPEWMDATFDATTELRVSGVANTFEKEYVRKDGGRVPVFVGGATFEGMPERGVAYVLDLTAQKQAEAEWRDTERRYRDLVEQADDGILLADANGNFLLANPKICQLLGYTEVELLRLNARDTYPSEEAAIANVRTAGAGPGETLRFERRMRRKDGTLFPVEVSLTRLPDGTAQEIVRDISERQRAEETLRLSERHFRSLIEQALDLITVVDEEGVITYASPSNLRVLGYAPEELVGRRAFDLVHPDDLDAALATFTSGLRDPGGVRTLQYRLRHKNGSWRRLEAIRRNLFDDPAVRGAVINSRDVTDRQQLEEQLYQAQRIEAVGRLAGGVAHDFNNILTAIISYAELLSDDMPGEDPRAGDLQEILKAAHRGADLTRQLLAFSRRQVLALQALDLNALVTGTEKLLRRLIGEDVTLETHCPGGLGVVRADPGQIEQVLMNLVVNARDAMPKGGRITIETANAELDQTYAQSHESVQPGPYVMLAVTDTGIGMSRETLPHIFEPFFTTKEKGQGTGLGLATVYGIVKQSGGYIWVYSEPGRGTTIKVYLPRVATAASPVVPLTPPEQIPRGTETILLAEDEPAVRHSTATVLTRFGYAVIAAADGESALHLAAEHPGPIHILLTDVVMPGMGGRVLAERLTAARPETRVLYLSGYTDDAVVRHGVLEGDVTFLQKPFTPEALARKVREVLDGGTQIRADVA